MSEVLSDDCVLRLERRLNVPPEKVFAAWAEPDQLAQFQLIENGSGPLLPVADPLVGCRTAP